MRLQFSGTWIPMDRISLQLFFMESTPWNINISQFLEKI